MSNSLNHVEQGVGTPLIFIHGIGSDALGWQYQLDAFGTATSGTTYRAMAVDLPGFGTSAAIPSPTIATYAQTIHSFIQQHQLEKPILVGHSLGGMIVQTYLATYPASVRAAVLYGTSPAFGPKDGEWQQKFIKARLAPLDAGKTMRALAPSIVQQIVGPKAQPEGVALAVQRMEAIPDETFRAAILSLADFDQRANLGSIDIPCLLIVGSEDTNAPPPMMEKMASKISGAHYHCLPDLGHLAHLENAIMFNQALATFLEGLK